MNYLFHITGHDLSQVFAIPKGSITIGREPGRDISFPHPLVSRLHAQLESSESECYLTDLGSANGTLVGGEPITPHVPYPLKPGDKISIGPYELLFALASSLDGAADDTHAGKLQPQAERSEAQHIQEYEPTAPGISLPVEVQAVLGNVPPPPETPPPGPDGEEAPVPTDGMQFPPGLSIHSRRLIHYMPGIFSTDFMSRFLAMFESIIVPIEWNVDNFDLYLDPATAPAGFLPWLAGWFEILFDDSWTEQQRREFLKSAHLIYARRGTRWALSRAIEIYTGQIPEIVDQGAGLDPHTFTVRLPVREAAVRRELLERVVDANKPAHTTYRVAFIG